MKKQVVVIAGPAGSGKGSIIAKMMERFSNATKLVTATSRKPRPGEMEGVAHYFITNEEFKRELAAGLIPEHYHRRETDTYYGTYLPDIDRKLAADKIIFCDIQHVGAQYMKDKYNATTFFIMPPSLDAFEHRIRARSPMSDVEWAERQKITEEEVQKYANSYDYRITNEDGKLKEAVDSIVEILTKEGYSLLAN